jgi:hypothetical protein
MEETMRRLPVFVLALLFGLTALGCDSNEDDDLTEAEILVGEWTVTAVSDNEGDKTSVFTQGVESFSANLTAAGTYNVLVVFTDERPDVPLAGTYTLNEGANSLVLIAGPLQLPFTYDIVSEDEIDLTTQDAFVEALFGTAPETYVGNVTFTIERE